MRCVTMPIIFSVSSVGRSSLRYRKLVHVPGRLMRPKQERSIFLLSLFPQTVQSIQPRPKITKPVQSFFYTSPTIDRLLVTNPYPKNSLEEPHYRHHHRRYRP
jgi:hypothetical protein